MDESEPSLTLGTTRRLSFLLSADEIRGGREETAGWDEGAPATKGSGGIEASRSLEVAEQQDTGARTEVGDAGDGTDDGTVVEGTGTHEAGTEVTVTGDETIEMD